MSNEKTPATNQELGRKLGLGAVIALGVGTTVGSGIFSSLSEVANAAAGLGMEVYGYDPYISVNAAWMLSRDVKHITSVDRIYQECDYITVL